MRLGYSFILILNNYRKGRGPYPSPSTIVYQVSVKIDPKSQKLKHGTARINIT